MAFADVRGPSVPAPRWTWRRRGSRDAAVRRRLAEGFERAVARTQTRWGLTAAVPVAPEAAGGARAALLDLAERLRGPRPVTPAGLRTARRLLTDGAGPLYVPAADGDLRRAAQGALAALDDGGGPDGVLP